MPIVCLGLSHRTAPVEVRESHAFPPARMAEALVALRDYAAVREAAMLQTCGRLEIYADLDDFEAGVAQLKEFLANFRHAAVMYDLESYLYTHLGAQAIEHLFRVSTGLDSMLIGEAEVLGQIKDAYAAAQRAGSLGKTLHRLFREALNAGKTARARTAIGDESASIATAAIDLARERLGGLEGVTVLVVGAGKMGRIAAKRLRAEGASRVIVANRTISRAYELVAEIGFGDAVEMPEITASLCAADIVISSTGASHFVLTAENVGSAMSARPQRPLFIVDIAVPRDAEPEIAEIPNVTLADVDDLAVVVDGKLEIRREAIPDVEEIVEEFASRFGRWYRARLTDPIVSSLTEKAETIRTAELERVFARCPDLSERERMLVTGMSMTIVSKLLHSAVTRIREKAYLDQTEALAHARVLDELFELNLADHIVALIAHPAPIDLGP